MAKHLSKVPVANSMRYIEIVLVYLFVLILLDVPTSWLLAMSC